MIVISKPTAPFTTVSLEDILGGNAEEEGIFAPIEDAEEEITVPPPVIEPEPIEERVEEHTEPPPAIELLVRWNFRGNRNILQWSGAETRRVKVFVEGRLRPIKTRNDGKFKTYRRLSGRSYQVCENRRNGDCSDVVPAP